LDPATVRRHDTSAASINEWTGEKMLRDEDIPDDVEPTAVTPVGNYAVQITWQDGFNQVRPGRVGGYSRLGRGLRRGWVPLCGELVGTGACIRHLAVG